MREYREIFSHLDTREPRNTLRTKLLGEITRRKRRHDRFMFAVSLFGGGVSGVTLFAAANYSTGMIANSGFSEYFSLLFSDGASVISYWKEFLITLVESLPLLGLTAVILSLLAFLVSLRGTYTYSHTSHARLA